MYVKKLTLHGFKSFAKETVFEFGPGVTGIVGPNGSGKSNVADAFRWVLGEQGLRLLRARRQEDVIYSGGGERAPLGLAEVSLTLDNSDRWLPLDFAEVELGRRTYRDGDTEYLVNGSRVRLRDIVELLQKANVGQNSYAVMGQGMVDEVLSMSPQERRSLVDEAADIKRFRTKIADAHDRLAATRENMGRVQLIIDELEPRLRQLRRQAERAGEHTRLSARLMQLLREYYANRWSEAQNALVRARAGLDQRTAEEAASSERLLQVRGQIHTLGEEIAKRRESIARRERSDDEFDRRIRGLEHAIALDRERHGMVTARHEELRLEIQAIEAEKASLSSTDIDEGRRELAIVEDAETARASLDHHREALDLAQRDHGALRGRLQERRGEIAALETRLAELERIAAAGGTGGAAQRELEQIESRRKQLLVELIGYGRRFAELRNRTVDGEERLEAARLAAEEARARHTRVQQEQREHERAGHEDLRKLDHLEGRLEALRRVQAESEGVAVGTRNVLIMGQALIEGVEPGSLGEAPEVAGVLGLLSRQLRVPAGLETAVNAALEQRLHAVIVEREEQAARAIQLLNSGARGRAQFLPLDTVRHVYPLNLQKERGVVGVAAKLVRSDPPFRELVDTLLGRIIIVEDREAAQRMIKRGLGSVVTLDGTLYEPSGVITGGAAADDEGVFTRQRELEEIPAQIEELRARTDVNAKQVEAARQTLETVSRALGETEGAYDALRRELDGARDDLERERDRYHRLRRDMVALLASRSELEREEERAERAATVARAGLVELTAQREAHHGEVAALENELGESEARVEAAMAEVSAASGRLAAVDGERKALEVLRQQHEQAIERLSNQLNARTLQARNQELEGTALRERIEKQVRELAAVRDERARAGDDVAPDRDELHRLESHERAVQQEYEEAQAAQLDAQRRRLELEAEVARGVEHCESLKLEMEREGLAPSPRGDVVTREEALAAAATEEAAPAIQGGAIVDVAALEREIDDVRAQIRRLGPINQEATEDYRESEERHTFLTEQIADLTEAEDQLRVAIEELNGEIRVRFATTFERVQSAFSEHFSAFFGGGEAHLLLIDPDDVTNSGIEIEAQPPGKRLRSLALLSGGERSLTAVALLFALLTVNPAPFCVLDEVDAALDEANVGRFSDSLKQLADRTQFLIVTHNRRTIEAADAIYGVSMGGDGVSKTISMRLSDLPAE